MALQARRPQKGATIQVIGAGLGRTGTNSFCAAVEALLKGPAYHVGVQSVLSGDRDDVIPWIEIANLRPYGSPEGKKQALSIIARKLDGFVVTADPPLSLLIPELMQLYPNAMVICTTRDKETWATSMALLVKMVKPRLQAFLFFWLGNQFTYLPALWNTFTKLFAETYGRAIETREDAYIVYDAHHAWLNEIVPADRLVFFDVKDGWPPLCQALGVDIPDAPFPRLNDAKSIEDVFKAFAVQGLMRWAGFFGVLAIFLGGVVMALRR